MKITTPILCLAAAAMFPATAVCQEKPDRERADDRNPRMAEGARQAGRKADPQGRRSAVPARPAAAASSAWRIGVFVDPVDAILRAHLKLPKGSGVVVREVVAAGPAAKAGLRKGDLILTASGRPVGDIAALREAVDASARSGEPLVLGTMKEGRKKEVRIAPPVKPKAPAQPRATRPARPSERGAPPAIVEQNRRMAQMGGALREMRAELDKQRETIRRLEKQIGEINRRERERE